ncbi:hypothetical protein M0R72_10945 [Candidatus Pacearchaeota archaeon]|jgi:hypothetical protein|nr:hypothetical protein [Candidatus Pacearchaeota archaeon]
MLEGKNVLDCPACVGHSVIGTSLIRTSPTPDCPICGGSGQVIEQYIAVQSSIVGSIWITASPTLEWLRGQRNTLCKQWVRILLPATMAMDEVETISPPTEEVR